MVLYVSCRHFSLKGSLPKTRMYLSYDTLLSCWICYHTEYVFIYRIIKIISSAFVLSCITQLLFVVLYSLRPSDAYKRRYSNHHWFRKWLVAWSAPSHYLKQCSNIVNWALWNKLQRNFIRNSYIYIHENAFENVVWKMAAILPRPRCVEMNLCFWSSNATDAILDIKWDFECHIIEQWQKNRTYIRSCTKTLLFILQTHIITAIVMK